MHLGIDNRNFSSKLRANQLEMTEDKKCVLVDYRMTVSCRSDAARKKANATWAGYFQQWLEGINVTVQISD